MKRIFYLILIIQISLFCKSQSQDIWTAFTDEKTALIGFKDSNGNIKIEPKFLYTNARKFENIIAVTVKSDNDYISYYLTKSGKMVGYDNTYNIDNDLDCESEGYIRFEDKKSELVGLFDKNGNIVIPAVYNDISRVNNSLIIALKDAKKEYWDDHEESGCNHYSWKGGKQLLINTKNEVLIENFIYKGNLNFYDFKITADKKDTISRQIFKGTNGKFYSFINFEKEFDNWIKTELLKNLTLKKLEDVCADSVLYWIESEGWLTKFKTEFLENNFEILKNTLQNLKEDESDFFYSLSGINPYMYSGDDLDKYFNNCGESLEKKYPVIEIIINIKKDDNFVQDHIAFLRTDNGYKLLNLSLHSNKLK